MSNKKISRGTNKTKYHYKLVNDKNTETEFFKTTKEITEKYGISRGNIYLMTKNKEAKRRIYNHIHIDKINEHYLTIDHGISENLIL
jgi:hypothetical protein